MIDCFSIQRVPSAERLRSYSVAHQPRLMMPCDEPNDQWLPCEPRLLDQSDCADDYDRQLNAATRTSRHSEKPPFDSRSSGLMILAHARHLAHFSRNLTLCIATIFNHTEKQTKRPLCSRAHNSLLAFSLYRGFVRRLLLPATPCPRPPFHSSG